MFKHIVAGGCSFTADGIGGVPPRVDSQGGCSFVHGQGQPRTWVSFIAQQAQVNSLINLSGNGFSIGTTAHSITWALSNHDYDPSSTLVLFNITDPARLGVLCPWIHVDCSRHTPWTKDIIPWQVLDIVSSRRFYRDMQIEQVESRSWFELQALLDFLDRRKFAYKFTMMMDYTNHDLLGPLIRDHPNLIRLDPGPSMFEYAMITQQLDADGVHPSRVAHSQIATQVLDILEI